MIETQLAAGGWARGADFSLADCAAAPSLFYANKVEPSGAFKNISAYLERLQARPSFARVLDEAEPYFQFFPKEAD
jgi:glutathione S-transferase